MVSFILCIAMCMALAIPAFAVELSPYATDEVGNFSQMIEFAFSDNVEGRFNYLYPSITWSNDFDESCLICEHQFLRGQHAQKLSGCNR